MSTAHALDLLSAPWIPVRWASDASPTGGGELPDRLGIRDLLSECHRIESLAVADPPAHAALLRVLYALTARVTGLDERAPATGTESSDWGDRRLDILDGGRLPLDGIARYFDRYGDRFHLCDPDGGRPWMQDPRLVDECDADRTAGVNKLIVTRPSGNNHSWFQHTSDITPEPPRVPEAVLNMLVWHYYGPSGRCSARQVNGVKSASMTAGPLRTALSYHPEGHTLFQSLLAGLVEPDDSVRRERDQCPWEWEKLPDPDAAPPAPSGPCSRLTACSQHALLLVPDESDPWLVRDAYITWAYRSGRIPRDDDYLIWQISQQGNLYPRPADSRRALWRDLDALLLAEPPGTARPRQPRVFEKAHEISDELRVRALGFEQEGQAKDTQFVDALTPAVLGHTEQANVGTVPAVGQLRELGELYGRRLDRAVKRAWAAYTRDAKASGQAWAEEAAHRYWPAAEAEFWARFRRLDRTGQTLDVGLDVPTTRRAFLRIAQDAYDEVTASAMRTQPGAKAVSHARFELYGGRRQSRGNAV